MVTEEYLRFYFSSKFGVVSEVKIMFDHSTPKPHRHRGFAFVTFLMPEVADEVCRINYHQIMDKKVEIKLASIAEEPTRGKILPTLPSRKNVSQTASTSARTPVITTTTSTPPTVSLTTSSTTGKESKKIPPPLLLDEAPREIKPAIKAMGPPAPPPLLRPVGVSAPSTPSTHHAMHPPPPPSPIVFAPYSPYPIALQSPLHSLSNPHPFYAGAAQSYPLMSPLAFPAYPFAQPLFSHPQQVLDRPPLIQSPMPSIDGDSVASSEPPSVFVFPSVSPVPGSDSGRFSPCPSSVISSTDDSCGGEVSAGPSPIPSPIPEMLHQQSYYSPMYWSSALQQPPHQMPQDPAECRTPNAPFLSPLMPPYYPSAMTPTAYDSFAFYPPSQPLMPPPPPGFEGLASPAVATGNAHEVVTDKCCRGAIEEKHVPCEVHSNQCPTYHADIYGNYYADAWCESRE